MNTLPQPWTEAMEATMFTGWIYDYLLPRAALVKVANPLMLRAAAAADSPGRSHKPTAVLLVCSSSKHIIINTCLISAFEYFGYTSFVPESHAKLRTAFTFGR